MKLDVKTLRYLDKDAFRVLQAVELGQKNVSPLQAYGMLLIRPRADTVLVLQHEIVPVPLIDTIAGLKCACPCQPSAEHRLCSS